MVKEQPPCGSNSWRPMGDPHCPRLASRVFSVLELQRPRNAGGFVHSPAFWKQRPEGAMNQNTTWHEWCCIALPKRIRTKRALCELYEGTPSFSLLELPYADAIACCLSVPSHYSWHRR
ncbi:unnamed protein product [Penicillium salamii]|nr:unnamed protein product [Penicillium nalgiovense]CAG8070628.1 unnamed protein product [Penicillium salamii]CAG8101715.1 unnamed protein product [Penicillium salamii]CAG8125898.1 unnamed protein product [Penicillium nalgiovense]CAG8134875.1 unnamed protein product [Penicillium nalgiovense]